MMFEYRPDWFDGDSEKPWYWGPICDGREVGPVRRIYAPIPICWLIYFLVDWLPRMAYKPYRIMEKDWFFITACADTWREIETERPRRRYYSEVLGPVELGYLSSVHAPIPISWVLRFCFVTVPYFYFDHFVGPVLQSIYFSTEAPRLNP